MRAASQRRPREQLAHVVARAPLPPLDVALEARGRRLERAVGRADQRALSSDRSGRLGGGVAVGEVGLKHCEPLALHLLRRLLALEKILTATAGVAAAAASALPCAPQ